MMILHRVNLLRPLRRGFTLIEAALVTSIISFGVVAMLTLLATGTAANNDGAELTTGMNLAKNIHEMCLGLAVADPQTPTTWGLESGETLGTFDDLDDLAGRSFSPPIDARQKPLSDYTGWQQMITVRSVDPNLLTSLVPNGSSPATRVTVTIRRNGRTVCTSRWLMFDAMP